MIAPCAGALWVGLMAAAGEPAFATPTPTPAGETAAPSTSPIVAVKRPPPGDAVLAEAGSRLRSELAAMGLEGQFVDCPPTESDGSGCPAAEATATISLARQDDGIVEIGVRTILPDGLELSRRVRVLARDGEMIPPSSRCAPSSSCAICASRSSARPHPAPPGPRGTPKTQRYRCPHRPPVPPFWRLSTGVAMLASPASNEPGVGPALGVAISAGAVVGPRLLVVASFAGPFNTSLSAPSPILYPAPGRLVQALATLELRFRFMTGPLEPFGSVLTGVNYLKATIPGADTMVPTSITSAWVPLFGIGGGVSWTFWNRFYACANAAVFGTQPDQLVDFLDAFGSVHVVARTGAPSILISSSVGLTLP